MWTALRQWLGALPKGYVILYNKNSRTYTAYSHGKEVYTHNDKDRLKEICWDYCIMGKKNKGYM